jgi:hypothetical protein
MNPAEKREALKNKFKRYNRANVRKIIVQDLSIEEIAEQVLDFAFETMCGPPPKKESK